MKILLKGGEIITLDGENKVINDGCVGITGEEIDYVGPYDSQIDSRYERVIDCRGKVVMPGFVNSHNHASMVMFRNYADDMKLMDWLYNRIFPLEDKLDEESAYWGSCLAILEMIRSGTTAFLDMYFFMESTVKAVSQSGIRAVLSRGLTGDSGEDMDTRLKEGIELYEKYNCAMDGRIKVMLGPHSVYTCSVPYLEKVNSVALEYSMPIHVHVSETMDEVRNCRERYGVSPVKLLDNIGMLKGSTVAAHCVVVDDYDIEILKERKVNVAHCPNSNMKLASGIAPVKKMMDCGINICIGTDGASSNNNLDMLEEMRFASYLAKVACDDPTALPVDTCLKMATLNGAKALGFSNTGCIKKDMAADIVIIDTRRTYYYPKYNTKSAIMYSGNSNDVETVIINGNIVMEDGRVLTMDEERVLFEAERCSRKLTS